jgi:hypothetical protein
MAFEALAPIAELALYALAALAEFSVYIIVASIRPWRYVLSPSYRQEFDAQYASRHPILKWLSLIGGILMLAASAIVAYAVITLFINSHQGTAKQIPTIEERVMNSATSAATQWLKSKSSSSP